MICIACQVPELSVPVTVHLLKPIGADSFEDDAQKVFLRYVTSQRSSSIEVIWDISQIFSAPERRVNVTRSSVAWNTKTLSNWHQFFEIDVLLTCCHVKWKEVLYQQSSHAHWRKSRYTYYTPRVQGRHGWPQSCYGVRCDVDIELEPPLFIIQMI